MLRSCLVSLMILLAPSAHAGSRFGGGGLHAGRGGFHGGGVFHRGVSGFHRIGGRGFFGGYGYGYNCGIGFDCGVPDYGYGYGRRRRGKCRQQWRRSQRQLCTGSRRRRYSARYLSH